jgi:hypothetical protein
MQPDKLRQWHMWQRMSWVQLPTQSGPHAQRPMKVSVTRQVAWNVNGNVHNFRAKSGISCLTTRSCATKSAGSYSIADRLACTTTTTLVSNFWDCHLEYKVKEENQKYFAKSAQHSPATHVASAPVGDVHPTLRQAQERLVGVGGFSNTLRGLELIPSKRRYLVPPSSPHQGATRQVPRKERAGQAASH